ncbi:MAG: hypothetical protein ORN54_08130 [Cyclobacteriaceae bacterium]|nr:hypothetical protein [Cyclobacteriaceae bacterium]
MSWLQKLQVRWKVNNLYQVVIILFVFACTGFTVLLIKKPLFQYWFAEVEMPLWASILYYVLILPVYNIFLLLYGFLFGQFQFFWQFEKRVFGRIASLFSSKK